MCNRSILHKILRSFAKLQIFSGRLFGIGGSTSIKLNLTAGVQKLHYNEQSNYRNKIICSAQ